MLICINSMDNCDKTNFMMSGFQTKYVNEWEVGYTVISDFIAKMYHTHCQLLGSM